MIFLKSNYKFNVTFQILCYLCHIKRLTFTLACVDLQHGSPSHRSMCEQSFKFHQHIHDRCKILYYNEKDFSEKEVYYDSK